MSEEPKNIRLNKAAKEFNVGIPNLVEYLAKKGHQVDANPNARITPEQYALLATAFQSERVVKENADRIEISTNSSMVIEATNNATSENREFGDEVIIKNFNTPKAKTTAKPEAEDADEPDQKPEASAETPVPEPETEPEVEPQPKFETKVIRTSVAGVKEGKNAFDAEVRIVDKIDLSSINTKVRPAKQTKAEKEERQAKKKKESAKAAKPEPTEKAKVEAAAPEVAAPVTPEPEPTPAPAPEKAPEKEIEFIETQYQKLEGPKVVTKIDLTQFESKPKGREDEKRKKRKRIKKDGVKVDEKSIANEKQSGDNKNNKPAKDKKSELYLPSSIFDLLCSACLCWGHAQHQPRK